MRVESTNLRAAAQLVAILGQELIDENSVGLIELVKNGYDADATKVDVKLEHLSDPDDTRVIVHDNGSGMDMADVLERWMVAGYSTKAEQKQRLERTAGGRLPLGQMGIGRFATARLGKKLRVVSRKAGQPEIYFEVDWDRFAKGGDIGDVSIQVVEREPTLFKGDSTGTRLAMLGAPEPWTEADAKAVQRKLMRLVSPLHTIPDFEIALACPEFPDAERIEPERIIDNFHWKLTATIDADGKANVKVDDKLGGRVETEAEVDLWKRVRRPLLGINRQQGPTCGPFSIELRGWRLRKAELDTVNIKDRKSVQELAGISVFRDDFRVLPYGEFGNDWLELNKRRVNNPTERFSTNQLIGVVDITTGNNAGLLDQANRLGLQQNAAFRDFRDLVLSAIGYLEDATVGAESAKRAAERREAAAKAAADRWGRGAGASGGAGRDTSPKGGPTESNGSGPTGDGGDGTSPTPAPAGSIRTSSRYLSLQRLKKVLADLKVVGIDELGPDVKVFVDAAEMSIAQAVILAEAGEKTSVSAIDLNSSRGSEVHS